MTPFAIEKLMSLIVKSYSKSSRIDRLVISRIVTILTIIGLLISSLRITLSIGILSFMAKKYQNNNLSYLLNGENSSWVKSVCFGRFILNPALPELNYSNGTTLTAFIWPM